MSHPHIRAKDDSSLFSTCTSESRFLLSPLSIPAVRAILRRPRRLLGWLLLRGLHTPPLLLLWGLLRSLLAPSLPLLLERLLRWLLRDLLAPSLLLRRRRGHWLSPALLLGLWLLAPCLLPRLWRLRRLLTPLLGLTPLLLLRLSLPAILHELLLLRHRCQCGFFGGM